MGCSCKKVAELQNKQNENQNDSYFGKFVKAIKRIMVSLLIIPLMVLTVPIIIIILSYQLLVGKTMGIKVPSKFIEKLSNGKKL